MAIKAELPAACPCGSGRPYEACCGPAIDGGVWPETAEALMRSRYTAYAQGRYDWLVETTHPDYRDGVDAESLARNAKDVRWLRLDIRRAAADQPVGKDGGLFDIVDFYAYYECNGTRQVGERSFFQRKEGKVYYVDGVPLKPAAYRRVEAKVGRNDPCPCGSGKKYKKCCGAAPA